MSARKTATKSQKSSSKAPRIVPVVLLSPLFFRNYDNVEAMIIESLVAIGWAKGDRPLFRLIPTKKPLSQDALDIWFRARANELDSPFSSNGYRPFDSGSPAVRNNLAVLGKDDRTGEEATHGRAKAIIQLGLLPGHYIRDDIQRPSGPESLLWHFTQVVDPGIPVVQVLEGTHEAPTPEVRVNPTEWAILNSERTKLEAPPKRNVRQVLNIAEETNRAKARLGL